jgi:hypothetical protein
MGILLPAPDHLMAQGIAAFDGDVLKIEEALQRINPDLYLGIIHWGWKEDRVAIFITDNEKNPYGDKPENDHVIKICEDTLGGFRLPNYEDVKWVREGDMRREENSYENLVKRRDAKVASQEREWDDVKHEMAKDLFWRTSKAAGYERQVSMAPRGDKKIKKVR